MESLSIDGAHALMDRAEWLALGYVQGQRDLILQLLEDRFGSPLPAEVRTQIANASPVILDQMSPVVLSAVDLDSALASISSIVADMHRESA